MKKCSRCKEEKLENEFGKKAAALDGLRSECKPCRKKDSRITYKAKPELLKTKAANFRIKNPNYNKDYYAQNSEYFKTYRAEQITYYKTWRQNNREKLNAYQQQRKANNIECKIKAYLRSRLWLELKKSGAQKTRKTLALLGCSAKELQAHLASKFLPGMAWDNYGQWHVDHIKPCCSFNLTLPEQQAQCFHFTNLQPLWAIDNLRKNKY